MSPSVHLKPSWPWQLPYAMHRGHSPNKPHTHAQTISTMDDATRWSSQGPRPDKNLPDTQYIKSLAPSGIPHGLDGYYYPSQSGCPQRSVAALLTAQQSHALHQKDTQQGELLASGTKHSCFANTKLDVTVETPHSSDRDNTNNRCNQSYLDCD